MAIFRPYETNRVCLLNFDNRVTYELPLHEHTAQKIAEIAQQQVDQLQALDHNDPNTLDQAYNMALDALDEILGEGEAEVVMGIFKEPSLFDVAAVVRYISEEFREAYTAALGEQKREGITPNRAQRRAGGRR